MSTPKKNVAYTFYISLIDSADSGSFKANPTIAAGDFKASTDGGAFGNLATLPSVDPAGSIGVKIDLSAGEMNGDKVMVQGIDAAGAEWDDIMIYLDIPTVNVDDTALSSVCTEVRLAELAAANLPTDIAAIPTVMVGTDNAALASVCTEARLAELAAANLPSDIDTLLTRVSAAVALASVCTESRLSELDGANLPADIDTLLARITAAVALASVCTEGRLSELDAANLPTDIDTLLTRVPDTISLDAIADATWDEILTGATHNIATSAGRRLRQVEAISVLSSGVAQDGGAGSITLAAGESAVEDFYNHAIIVITAGTGIGQARAVHAYDGGTKVATIVPNWETNPAVASEYLILADTEKHVYEVHANAINAASIATDAIDADALADSALAEIKTQCDSALTDYDGPTEAEMDTAHALLATVAISSEARLAELDAANIPADIDTLLTRLSAARAGYLDNISVGAVALAAVCTEVRLAELAAANLPADIDLLLARITASVALASVCTEGRLAELDAGNLPSDVDDIKAKTDLQPAGVPKNVALSNFMFLMMDSTDHITPKTGLTVTATISKDGAAFGASSNAAAEVSSGMYKINWIQGEMNADVITFKFTAAGADDRFITIITSS